VCDSPAGGVASATDVRTAAPDERMRAHAAPARCFFAGCALAETTACRFLLSGPESERRALVFSGCGGGAEAAAPGLLPDSSRTPPGLLPDSTGGGGGGAEAARVVICCCCVGLGCGRTEEEVVFFSGCAATLGFFFLGSTGGSGSVEAARLAPVVGGLLPAPVATSSWTGIHLHGLPRWSNEFSPVSAWRQRKFCGTRPMLSRYWSNPIAA
jgi:hypothetical protein